MGTLRLLLVFIGLSLCQWLGAQDVSYDSTLAKQLQADDYGMRKYTFVLLKTGPNTTANKAFIDSCFAGHMQNIERLAAEGKLVVAGPYSKNEEQWRGLFIFASDSFEQVEQWLAMDPAIKNQLLTPSLFSWYGSAALPTYLPNHDKVTKKKF